MPGAAAEQKKRGGGKGGGKSRTRSPSPRRLTPVAEKLAKEQKVCYSFVLGTCSRGDKCPFNHTSLQGLSGPATQLKGPRTAAEKKATPCFFFKKGTCRAGDKCEFSHEIPPGGAAMLVPEGAPATSFH